MSIALEILKNNFDADFFSTDSSDLKEYGKDWTKVYTPNPTAICFPKTTEEVAKLMKLCHENKIAVVPSGGRTGLAAGAVAKNGEVVLSLKKMNRIEAVDVLSLNLKVQAGAITEAVHKHCEPHGLTWPVDFASKGSSTVGGNISTNAGGVKVIRYGLTRQWVLGLQVVTPKGEILELNGSLEKNNTGMDLRQLYIGTEGTLGIITEATLKLTRVPGDLKVFLFSLETLREVLDLFKLARTGPFTLMAYEFFTQECLTRVMKHLGSRTPFEKPQKYYALMEVESSDAEKLENWLMGLFEKNAVKEGVLAQNPREAAEFWALRETIAESVFATGLPHKNDVALPIHTLEAFCSELEAFFAEHYKGWEICNFGHIGDGNLHINIMKPDDITKEDFLDRTHQVDHDLFRFVRKYQGSISAEHGIGLLKKDFLDYSRTPPEMALLRTIKNVMDPHGILNPGKIFD